MAITSPEAAKLGAGEAARLLGVSAEYLRYLARAGRVEFELTPYGRTYDADDIERLRVQRDEKKGAA